MLSTSKTSGKATRQSPPTALRKASAAGKPGKVSAPVPGKRRTPEKMMTAQEIATRAEQNQRETNDGEDWGATSREEIERFITTLKGTVTMMVTPAVAKCLLEHNIGNRKLRQSRVDEFADIYRQGRHQNTGEPIIMSAEGILNNGQHRLMAIVASGVPVELDIRFGVPRKAFEVTDTHTKRLAGDVLASRGDASVFAVAAAAKLLIAYERGLPASYWRVYRNDEIVEAVERWPDIYDAVSLTQKALKSRRGFINAATNAFTFLALRQAGEKSVLEFLQIVETGIASGVRHPARVLRERLLNDETLRHATREKVIERLALFVKAWNAWRAGQLLHRLTFKGSARDGGEEFPVMEGIRL